MRYSCVVYGFRLVLLFLALLACKKEQNPEASASQASAPESIDHATSFTAKELGVAVNAAWKNQAISASIAKVPVEAVYLAARQNGRLLDEQWGEGKTLSTALNAAHRKINPAASSRAEEIEIFVAFSAEEGKTKSGKLVLPNRDRGLLGVSLATDGVNAQGSLRRFSPTYVLATNRSHEKLVANYEKKGLGTAKTLKFLRGAQYLVSLKPDLVYQDKESLEPRTYVEMFRGNQVVKLSEVNWASVAKMMSAMKTWMHKSLHPNGRMTYLYWPSLGIEAPNRDNLIRQFMATVSLGRIAHESGLDSDWKLSASNLQYNLDTYFSQVENMGHVTLRGKVKLGALALAALAIVEHKDRDRWKKEETLLRASINALWQEDGSFRTFLTPPGRNDNQNFYPGEALLFWASLIAKGEDTGGALLTKFMKSFTYYKEYHLASIPNRRNPAFVPWHTQAYFLVWTKTHDPTLADFVFEMNDWLLSVQEWNEKKEPDLKGRFYDPKRPFGPPHASATGVYLEGLIDAYRLAEALKSTVRQEQYRKAIRRALRSSMQLQFLDAVDMYYVHKRDRVYGGLRTTVYDNQIRCDNIQHTLMGVQKILKTSVLE